MENAKMDGVPAYVRPQEAAKMFGVTLRTIYYWRNECKDFPKPVTIGRVVRWRASDLVNWFDAQAGKEGDQ